jgi:hypothetical protein
MSETQTKRPVGRPKKTAAQPAAKAPAKKSTVVRKEKPVNTNVEYEIPNGKGGIVTMIPMKGVTIYDEDQDTVREIRYCPNEPSIFVDEQSQNAKRETIIFENSRLFVPKTKPNLKKFMDLHPNNVANGGNLFVRVDSRAKAELDIQKEFLISDAVIKVRDTDINDLLPVALFFNIDVNQAVSEIRYNLLNLARKRPEDFINAFDDPTVVARSIAKQASDYQFIKLRENGVYWYDTNKLIVSVPVGRSALDVFTRFMLTEQGATVYSELEDKLSKLA